MRSVASVSIAIFRGEKQKKLESRADGVGQCCDCWVLVRRRRRPL